LPEYDIIELKSNARFLTIYTFFFKDLKSRFNMILLRLIDLILAVENTYAQNFNIFKQLRNIL